MPCAASRGRRVARPARPRSSRCGCGTRPTARTAHAWASPTTTRRARSSSSAGPRASHAHEELDVAVGAAQRRRHDVDHVQARRRAGRRAPRGAPPGGRRGRARSRPCRRRARPASNCGFTSSTRSPSGVVQRASAGATVTQRDERQVGDGEVDRAAEVARARGARTLVRSSTVTRGSSRSDHASCPRPTSTACTCAAPACSRQSVNPPVDAPASRARRPRTSTAKRVERGGQLLAAAGHEAGRVAGELDRLARAHQPGRGLARGSRRRGPARPRSPPPPDGGSRATPGARARRRVAGARSPAQDTRLDAAAPSPRANASIGTERDQRGRELAEVGGTRTAAAVRESPRRPAARPRR